MAEIFAWEHWHFFGAHVERQHQKAPYANDTHRIKSRPSVSADEHELMTDSWPTDDKNICLVASSLLKWQNCLYVLYTILLYTLEVNTFTSSMNSIIIRILKVFYLVKSFRYFPFGRKRRNLKGPRFNLFSWIYFKFNVQSSRGENSSTGGPVSFTPQSN